MSRRVLILGARGMLGADLASVFSGEEVTAWDKEEVDVTVAGAVREGIVDLSPDVVVNVTGYTDVEGAEENCESAFAVNDQGVANIAVAAEAAGAPLIHISTEMVFDGKKEGGYDENSEIDPINVYGRSKAAGERHVLAYPLGYVVRSSWLFGTTLQRGKPRGKNFVETVLERARAGEELTVVSDQFGKPTSTTDLSHAIYQLVLGSYAPGVYHLVNEGVASWYDVAVEVLKLSGTKSVVTPISAKSYKSKAGRPRAAILLNTKFPKLRSWQESLSSYLLNT